MTFPRLMTIGDIPDVVGLQRLCFPEPFPTEFLWQPTHLERHLTIFPEGQYVYESDGLIVGSASASLISEDQWTKHLPWEETLGGFFFTTFDPEGTTMYGADISVHPNYRKRGIAKQFYKARFDLVRTRGLTRYGTACRIPDLLGARQTHPTLSVEEYCESVASGDRNDRTLSPMLRLGLALCGVITEYMDDEESGNAAALLEWRNL